MQNQEIRHRSDLVASQDGPFHFLSRRSVVFGEDDGEGDLGDNVLFDGVLEEGRGGEIDREEEEWRLTGLDV